MRSRDEPGRPGSRIVGQREVDRQPKALVPAPLVEVEREHIVRTLELVQGNKAAPRACWA